MHQQSAIFDQADAALGLKCTSEHMESILTGQLLGIGFVGVASADNCNSAGNTSTACTGTDSIAGFGVSWVFRMLHCRQSINATDTAANMTQPAAPEAPRELDKSKVVMFVKVCQAN